VRPVHRKPHTPRNRNRIESPGRTPRRDGASFYELRCVVERVKPQKRAETPVSSYTRKMYALNIQVDRQLKATITARIY